MLKVKNKQNATIEMDRKIKREINDGETKKKKKKKKLVGWWSIVWAFKKL